MRRRQAELLCVLDGQRLEQLRVHGAPVGDDGLPVGVQVLAPALEEARKVMTPLMLSYVSESRVVDNSRMLEKLGVTLRYPSMTEGLLACR